MLESSRFFFPVFLNVQLTKPTAIPPLPALQWNVDAEGGVIHQRDAASLPKNERAFALWKGPESSGELCMRQWMGCPRIIKDDEEKWGQRSVQGKHKAHDILSSYAAR